MKGNPQPRRAERELGFRTKTTFEEGLRRTISVLGSSHAPSPEPSRSRQELLEERLRTRKAHVAVLGLGYAGLPMAIELARAGFSVTGLDIDRSRVRLINAGASPVSNVANTEVAPFVDSGSLRASDRFEELAESDAVLICVPTPLDADNQPDLHFVDSAAQSIAIHLHPGMLVVLQSTCSPGATRSVLLPALQGQSGLRVGEDLFVAFAPERIDPGNTRYTVRNTPKLVGGITPRCGELASLLFSPIVERVVAVSSPEVAELAKLVENTFRFINISFINEMALLCDRMGISVWEVVGAASTKPFAFMPHYPGPGVGGHCIPIVPFYLEAAAREHGMHSELIHAAGRINAEMPLFVVDKLERLLAEHGKSLAQARVLLLGMAYKPNVSDIRESPALRVLELLVERGAQVAYHDPYVPEVQRGNAVASSITREELLQRRFDCAILLTAHDSVDYRLVGDQVDFILDTRHHLASSDGIHVVYM